MRVICRYEGPAVKNQLKRDEVIFDRECIMCDIVTLKPVSTYVSEVAPNVNSYKLFR